MPVVCNSLKPLPRSFQVLTAVLLCLTGLGSFTGALRAQTTVTQLGVFPTNGGVSSSANYAGTAMVITPLGTLIAAEPNGNDVVSFDLTTGAATMLGSFSDVGTVAIDPNNNLYISTFYAMGQNIVKIPFVNGAYAAISTPIATPTSGTGGTPACTGTDTAECYVPNLTDSADGYYIQVRSMTFDAAGDIFIGTGEYEIIECTAYCLSSSPTVLYQEPPPTSTADHYTTGAMAVDANGNLFFTDNDFYATAATGYIPYSYSSNLKELVYTAGTGFAATPLVLDTYTPAASSLGTGPESDEITGLAIFNNTVYFTILYDGVYSFTDTNGIITPATPYTRSTQGGKVLAVDALGQFYTDSVDATTGADDLIEITIPVVLPVAAVPSFSVPGGTYRSALTTTLSSTTPGATIYYTTDGTTPTTSSTSFTGSMTFSVGASETIAAFAVATGYTASPVDSAAFVISLPPPAAATPTFLPAAGMYMTAQTVTLTSTTPGATIYYTTDGVTIPNIGSATIASGATITVSASETVMASSLASGYSYSPVATAVYQIGPIPQNFLLAINPSTLSVSDGSSGTLTVSVTPVDSLSSPVSFACSGLPSGATCTFSPATLTTSGTTISTTTLTVTPPAASAALQRGILPFFPGGTVAAAALCMLGLRKRRRLQLALMLMLGVVATSLVIGCSGGGSSAATTTGNSTTTTSTVTVTATAGSGSNTTTFTLTVQ